MLYEVSVRTPQQNTRTPRRPERFRFARLNDFIHAPCGNRSGRAIRAVLKRGELSADRLLCYEKLRTENAYSENAESYLAAKEEKFKKIAMLNKANRKK